MVNALVRERLLEIICLRDADTDQFTVYNVSGRHNAHTRNETR
jgi:hypothetical protein